MPAIDLIAFDADDTLWHTERLYVNAQARLAQLLDGYVDPARVERYLYQAETRNLEHFGYGVKAFALSMIETAVELTEGKISGADIQVLVGLARDMLTAPVELIDHVKETIPRLAGTYALMVITKGDAVEQEPKIARSGLAAFFRHVEVVSDKTASRYAVLLERYAVRPAGFLMVGNSLRSDILPVLELGAQAVYVPYATTWQHEAAEPPPPGQPGFHQLEHLGLLPALLQQLERAGS